jgi:Fe-S cluster assembly protein SufD
MNTIEQIRERFQEQQAQGNNPLQAMERTAFGEFDRLGIPTSRHEEWKYTRLGTVFNKEYRFTPGSLAPSFTATDLVTLRLPGHEEANALVFVNGVYAEHLSVIRSGSLTVQPLEAAAANGYSELVARHLGQSSNYAKDGIHALNTAFVHGGVFVEVKKGKSAEHPVYIYHISDARSANILAQPRSLVHVDENAQVQMVEHVVSIGSSESFTNSVTEVVLEKDARVEFYRIQNDADHNNQVSTTHFRQVGKSYLHAVTISLKGGIIRNNLNISLEAERSEAHLYGLYFLHGRTHVDNHTVVDHSRPNCPSNELYKGIMDDEATAVFNGKIYVRQLAQKTNAYQSNKNILLSEGASVNTKPQLEIFADDVKCSHGCTVGRLDEEGLFYLRSRGIPEKIARSLLVQAFAVDILEHIRLAPLRRYVDQLIAERLEFDKI